MASEPSTKKTKTACGRLEGKTVFITAAAQGIGRATAIACANEGAKVIATDVNFEKLQELGDTAGKASAPLKQLQLKVVSFLGMTLEKLDVTDDKAVEEILGKYGDSIDVLFNCAGYVQSICNA